MRKTDRIVYYSVASNRELLSFEGKNFTIPILTLNRDEALDLKAALADAIDLLDSQPPIPPLPQETPCSSAQPS